MLTVVCGGLNEERSIGVKLIRAFFFDIPK